METTAGRVIVAEATRQDIKDLINIGDECGLSIWSEEGYKEELNRADSILLIIKLDARPTAFIAARASIETDAELYNIGVLNKYRRRGLGKTLMGELISRCISKGAGKLWLDVRPSNTVAISFYERFGFTKVSTRRAFYTDPLEDSVTMVLELSRSN